MTWLKTMSIRVCGSYCIDLVLCSRSISWIGDILPYVKIKYWMSMNRVPVNWPGVLFLMAVMYIAFTANVSCWISACSTPCVS